VSAGVSGWGTDDVVHYLSTRGMALEPDVVLIVVTLYNDLLDNVGEDFHRLQAGRLVHHDDARLDGRAYAMLRLKSFLSGHFHLYQLVRGVLRRDATGSAFASLQDHWVDLLRTDTPPLVERGFVLTEALLDEAAELARTHDARLVVALIPMEEQLRRDRAARFLDAHGLEPAAADLTGPQRRLRAWGERAGVEVVDLLDPFAAYERAGGQALYFVDDGHWNERGHALAASVLADALMDRRVLESARRAR